MKKKSAGVAPIPVIVISVVAVGILLALLSHFNYQRNITPHKKAVDVEKVPAEVKAFLSNEDLQKMDANGMNIYTGDHPPKIEGDYEYKQKVIKYDSQGANFPLYPYKYHFRDQKDNTVVISYESEGRAEGEELATAKGVFISGEGDCFSVYLDTSGQLDQCQYKSAEIFSACKKGEEGFVDTDEAQLMTHHDNDQCSGTNIVPAGNLRIFTQKSLAPKIK